MQETLQKKFKEKLSPFLAQKIKMLEDVRGENDPDILALSRQYLRDPREDAETSEKNMRHYEAELDVNHDGRKLYGLERLYRRVLVIEPTKICAAHCRYCLRSNYAQITLSDDQLRSIAMYCGNNENKNSLCEVLITGGDPLILPFKLHTLVDAIAEYAPNIQTVRIGSRLPLQQPDKIDERVLSVFRSHPNLHFEIGIQVNHPIEFFPEVVEALQLLQEEGIHIYAQNVLLKGVNDDERTLIELYDRIRMLRIEAHYLFHCIPMKGIHHFRTSIKRGLELTQRLVCSGNISGRAKPMFAVMTDIGKIVLYDGTIVERDSNGRVLLQSNYKLGDRCKWVPNWILPHSAFVDADGYLRVWYLDGID